jgi:hypothetical protein
MFLVWIAVGIAIRHFAWPYVTEFWKNFLGK